MLATQYGSVKYVESRSSDSMGILAFFVVYNFITTEIINVYENNSEELLKAYESYAEFFFEDRGGGASYGAWQGGLVAPLQLTLPSNSFHAREAFRKQLYVLRTCTHGLLDRCCIALHLSHFECPALVFVVAHKQ